MTRKELLTKHKYKFAALFISVICLTCLNLCAEEMSTAHAKTYRENFVTEAKKYIGCSYVYGACGPDTFDCSGLIYYVAREANQTQLPRTARALYEKVKKINDEEREPGDLVFFKTLSSDTISHVGIYIGNNQFISAVSDGPNTGVILSSINEGYWNPRYAGAGQIYKSGKMQEDLKETPVTAVTYNDSNNSSESNFNASDWFGFLSDTVLDASLYGNWALLNSESFMINFRGLDFQANARLGYRKIQPGIGVGLRWNRWVSMFQIPVTLSLTLNDYIRLYMGPVFSMGKGIVKDSGEEVSASVIPGTIGAAFSTPYLNHDLVKFQLIQDISFSFFSKPDNSALSFYKTLANGLLFSTGVRATLPL